MRPDADDLKVNAYVDGEMDLGSQLCFEERLQIEPRLAAQVDALRSLSQSLRAGADYHAAPAGLRERIAKQRAALPLGTAKPPGRRLRERVARWFPWQALVPSLALAAVAAVAIDVVLLRTGDAQRQQEELVASHVRATLSQRGIDVASSDRHTVKPWFATQLDFSPPVHELDLPDSVLLGGRVDYVQGRRVAVLVYQVRKHKVDLYLWPAEGRDTGVEVQDVRGIKVAQWRQAGLAHRVVTDMSGPELDAVIAACRAG